MVLNWTPQVLSKAAEVYDAESGRLLECWTTEPGVHFYTANSLGSIKERMAPTYEKYRAAFCLETQHFPDSPNHPDYPSTILRPGEVYRQITEFHFSIPKQPLEGGKMRILKEETMMRIRLIAILALMIVSVATCPMTPHSATAKSSRLGPLLQPSGPERRSSFTTSGTTRKTPASPSSAKSRGTIRRDDLEDRNRPHPGSIEQSLHLHHLQPEQRSQSRRSQARIT